MNAGEASESVGLKPLLEGTMRGVCYECRRLSMARPSGLEPLLEGTMKRGFAMIAGV